MRAIPCPRGRALALNYPLDMHPSPEHLFNRELSWLDFNRRVLELARDVERPALERAKFLAIFAQNLDEFFQVRVSDLQDLAEGAAKSQSPDGLTPLDQLRRVREVALEQTALAQDCFDRELRPALRDIGLEIVRWNELSPEEQRASVAPFEEQIQPVLIPLGVDPAHPFPFVSGLSLSVGAFVRARNGGPERIARVKVPPFLPRWWEVGEGRYTPVEDLIRAHLARLFPEDEVASAAFFRVTRDADLELDERSERGAGDLVLAVEAGLRRRIRASDAVRLEVSTDLHTRICDLLTDELKLDADEVYVTDGLLDLSGLWELFQRGPAEHKDVPWTPAEVFRSKPGETGPASLFGALRARDVLVHHPYESFEGSVEAFLSAAANDSAVRVIMTSLYRTGGSESTIVQALQGAASRGKQIVVLIELQARFDEAANLERARSLERAGAHVVYGVLGLKTHAKLAFVVREEAGRLRRYCHVGTGNYNPAHCPRLRRPRSLHEPGGRHPRRRGALSTPHERKRLAPLRATARSARGPAPGSGRAHRGPGEARGPYRGQDERTLGPGHHRRALRRRPQRSRDRPDRAGHLLPASRGSRRLGAHPRALGAGTLSRTLSDVPIRRSRSGQRNLDRLRRLDAAQSRPAASRRWCPSRIRSSPGASIA